MKLISRIFPVVLLSYISVLAIAPLHAETGLSEHQHGHEGLTISSLSLNNGSKWKTDVPLRLGMKKISKAFFKYAPTFHNRMLTKHDAQKLANQISDQVDYLIANCKLEPRADETLHVLIAELLQAAEVISDDPLSADGMPKIHMALRLYPKYFEHTGE